MESLVEWTWSIIKDKTKMGFTSGANCSLNWNFVSNFGMLVCVSIVMSINMISLEFQCVDKMIPECWITTLINIFVITYEKVGGTASARVHADIFDPPELVSIWSLIADTLCHIVLKRSHIFLKCLGPFIMNSLSPGLESLKIFPTSEDIFVFISFEYLMVHSPIF